MIIHRFGQHTWIEPEEYCRTPRHFARRALARVDGTLRIVRAAIPDTFSSIPAIARIKGERIVGYLRMDPNGELEFRREGGAC